MATHSSILAWNIPWTEEPGGLQTMGSQESDMIQQLNHRHPCKGASQMALVVKNPSVNVGDSRDTGLIPGWERSPGGGHGNPPQFSCLENPTDRGAWQTTVHVATESQT